MLFKLLSDAIRDPSVVIATLVSVCAVAIAMVNWPVATGVTVGLFSVFGLLVLTFNKRN